MRALITGYKGFIGKNVVNALEKIKIECFCLDNEILENIDSLNSIISDVDIVFHIGAISDTSLQDANKMLKYNYWFSKKLFDAAQKFNRKVIYSSSAATYGSTGTPSNIYGWSKLLAEDYGNVVCDEFVSLRYFNVYGPGEEHKGKMSSVAYQAWLSRDNKFKLFPGSPKRDFVYIKDIVQANIAAIKALPGIYEVGSGEARTFEDVVGNLGVSYEYHSKDKIPHWYQFYTKSDESKWVPNWKPEFNLENGISDYLRYLSEKTEN